jgi:solute carrier family 25, member 38
MPISIIKVRFESNLYNYTSLAEASADIFKKEGFRGFFSGYGATALRDAPYAGIHLAIYEATKALLGGIFPLIFGLLMIASPLNAPSSGPLLSISSGAIAGLLATSMTQPFDMIKTRIQLAPNEYRNLWYGGMKVYNVLCCSKALLIIGSGDFWIFQGDVTSFGEKSDVCGYSLDGIRRDSKSYRKTKN